MGSSFCDPTREVCPFGAAIDPTLALVNNVYVRSATAPAAPTGIQGPLAPVAPSVQTPMPTSLRQSPTGVQIALPPLTLPGGVSIATQPFNFPLRFQQPQQRPPLLPGRIPPGPQVVHPGAGGCNGTPGVPPCCNRGYHPDKKWGVKCVKNRRMNVANMKAAKRATRRLAGFDKMARAAKRELKKLCR